MVCMALISPFVPLSSAIVISLDLKTMKAAGWEKDREGIYDISNGLEWNFSAVRIQLAINDSPVVASTSVIVEPILVF